MVLSPAELRHERPSRGLLFGYRRPDVDALLAGATSAYEDVWRERADLKERVHELDTELARYRESERALRAALVTAERAASELRVQAVREAELVVREAEGRAREIVHGAYAERERVRAEILALSHREQEFRARLRSLLAATLQIVRDHEERLAAGDGLEPVAQPQ
jgi:cell division initiation protein